LIEDKSPRFLEDRGLGFAQLQTVNPALVMTSISGFGSFGPYRDFKAPNIVAFAMGGLMNLCGYPGRAPLMGPCDVADHRFGACSIRHVRRFLTGAKPAAASMSMFRCKTFSPPILFCASSRVTA
jgi:crotonobetainyl-CoA:carnitine CoA-transferase CaiB-like acyl-CoA transferase